MPQTDIENNVSARDVAEMEHFYAEEPWGSWRDNAHAGMIVSAINQIWSRRKKIEFKPFMLGNETAAKRENLGGFVAWMRSMAKPRKDRKRGASSPI